jgi:Gluconate 2-dehydrogenase subunit 3
MIQSVLGVSAASALPRPLLSQGKLSQEKQSQEKQPQEKKPSPAVDENPKLPANAADSVANGVLRFFDVDGFQALRHLGEILVPARPNAPGAIEAEAAEFLDFLIGQSPSDRQTLYSDGVAHLNREARSKYGKLFAALSAGEAETILAPLREAWTYQVPKDAFARFLRAAKEDFLTATVNSRQWAVAASGRSRTASGLNTYWFPIE